MSGTNEPELPPVKDIYDDLLDAIKHTGSKELLKLLEDEVSDNSNIIDSIVELIINKVKDIEDEVKNSNSSSSILKILNKVGKLSQRHILVNDTINSLDNEAIKKYYTKLNESFNNDDKTPQLSMKKND